MMSFFRFDPNMFCSVVTVFHADIYYCHQRAKRPSHQRFFRNKSALRQPRFAFLRRQYLNTPLLQPLFWDKYDSFVRILLCPSARLHIISRGVWWKSMSSNIWDQLRVTFSDPPMTNGLLKSIHCTDVVFKLLKLWFCQMTQRLSNQGIIRAEC